MDKTKSSLLHNIKLRYIGVHEESNSYLLFRTFLCPLIKDNIQEIYAQDFGLMDYKDGSQSKYLYLRTERQVNRLDITQVFIQNLTNFAKGQEWSIQELCRILGIGVNSFYRWRGGRTKISMETAQGLIEKLNSELKTDMRLQYFLGEPRIG